MKEIYRCDRCGFEEVMGNYTPYNKHTKVNEWGYLRGKDLCPSCDKLHHAKLLEFDTTFLEESEVNSQVNRGLTSNRLGEVVSNPQGQHLVNSSNSSETSVSPDNIHSQIQEEIGKDYVRNSDETGEVGK